MNARKARLIRQAAAENTVGQSEKATKRLAKRLKRAIKRGQKVVYLEGDIFEGGR